jgi:hypothetical protein
MKKPTPTMRAGGGCSREVEERTCFVCVEHLEASRSIWSIFWNGMIPHPGGIFLFRAARFSLILNQMHEKWNGAAPFHLTLEPNVA